MQDICHLRKALSPTRKMFLRIVTMTTDSSFFSPSRNVREAFGKLRGELSRVQRSGNFVKLLRQLPSEEADKSRWWRSSPKVFSRDPSSIEV